MKKIGADQEIFFIVNPRAAEGKTGRRWQGMKARLQTQGLHFKAALTQGPNAAPRQVQAAIEGGSRIIIAIGGDGLVNEALNGMVDEEGRLRHPDLVLGFWPAGTGCDFARSVYGKGYQGDLYTLLTEGVVKKIDIGRLDYTLNQGKGSRFFINSSDGGLGADTCYFVNGSTKALGGLPAYLWGALKAILRFRYQPLCLEYDGRQEKGRYLMIFCNNGRYGGGGMDITPLARLDDGLLDLLIVREMSKIKILASLRRIYTGSHLKLKEISYVQAKEISLRGASLFVETDGEIPGKTPARFSILPQALPLLLPASALKSGAFGGDN